MLSLPRVAASRAPGLGVTSTLEKFLGAMPAHTRTILEASITISCDLAPRSSPLLRESQSQTLDVLNGTANGSARTG